MMRDCDIVKDLLFSYHDDIVSQSSKEFVEEHLKTCCQCQEILEQIKADKKEKDRIKEIDYLKKIRKKMNKKTVMIIISTVLLLFVIIVNFVAYAKYKQIASKMEIYLEEDISEQQKEKIVETIKNTCDTAEITYCSREEQLKRLKDKLGNQSYLLDSYEESNNPLHHSYVVKADSKAIEKTEGSLQMLSGIEYIQTYIHVNPYLLLLNKNQ